MKYTAAVLAILALESVSASSHWHMQADPCSKHDKKACLDDSTCRFTLKPRSETAGKKDSKTYGRHFGPAEKGGHCAAIHVYDRANGMSDSSGADMLAHHGLHNSWDTIPCTEAFFLKDCKDVSQHGTNTCSWSCEGGCEAAGEDGSKYRPCKPPVAAEAADAEAAAAVGKIYMYCSNIYDVEPPQPYKCNAPGHELVDKADEVECDPSAVYPQVCADQECCQALTCDTYTPQLCTNIGSYKIVDNAADVDCALGGCGASECCQAS